MRLLWREEVGRVDDPSSLVFVHEMGTHTSLGPLYAYAPIGERAFFEVPRNLKARTRRCWRASIEAMGRALAVVGAEDGRGDTSPTAATAPRRSNYERRCKKFALRA